MFRRMNIVENIEEMNWTSSLISSLKIPNRFRKEIKNCKPIQKGMWPVVSSLSSTLAIAGVSQGKTYGWILPLLNQLETKKNTTYDFLTPDYGGDPTCLVLVPDHTTAESLAETIKELVRDSRLGLEVAVAHHAVSEFDLTVSLLNSPDILVATPPQIHRLLYSYSASLKRLFFMNRCCHLVVEDAHTTLELFPNEMIHITRQFDTTHPDLNIKASEYEARPFQQLIIVGEYWCTAIQDYCSRFLFNGVTLIADMMEGAIRREIPLFPAFFSSTEKKVEKIIQICEDNRQNNIVVICKDGEAGSPIYDELRIQGFNPTFLREGNEEEKDNVLLGLGKINAGRIVLVTDVWWNIFPENQKLQISGDILIHSDLPSSPLTFKSRFSVLRGHMSRKKGLGKVVSSHIFICQQDKVAARDLNTLIRRTGSTLSSQLEHFLTSAIQERKISELKNPICAKTIQLGTCRFEDDFCQARHCLNPNAVFPTQGESVVQENPEKQIDEIRFAVLRVQSPVSFWAQIHQSGADKPGVSQDHISLQLSLALYYRKPKNRIIESVNNLKVGALVCVKEIIFKRAKITFVDKVCLWGIEKVEVQYLETGEKTVIGKTSIYSLADQFKEVPPLAQLVVLAGYKPPDKVENWSTECYNHIQRSVIPSFLCAKDGYYECRGKVLLRSPEIIWIGGCEVWNKGRTRLTYKLEIGEEIISTKAGVRNKEHYLQIRRLGEEVGLLPTPLLRKLSLHPGTGFTNLLDSQPTQVILTECFSPSLFFLSKTSELAEKEKIEKQIREYVTLNTPRRIRCELGDYVAVYLEEDQRWERGRIVRVNKKSLSADHVENKFEIYLLDQGNTCIVHQENISALPLHLRNKPCLAIPCRLTGVLPSTESGWSDESGDQLFDFSRDLSSDQPKVLTCVLDESTGGVHDVPNVLEGVIPTPYPVKLCYNDEDAGSMLISSGLARLSVSAVQSSDIDRDKESNLPAPADHALEDNEELFEDIAPSTDEQLDDFPDIEQKLERTKGVEHELEGANEQDLKSSTRSEQKIESVHGSEHEDESKFSETLTADLMKLIIENETESANNNEPTCKPTSLSCDTVGGVKPSNQVLNQAPKPVQLETMSNLRKPKLTFTDTDPLVKKLPTVYWTQTLSTVNISVKFQTFRDLDPNFVFVHVLPSSLELQVLEVEYKGDEELYTVHLTPVLQLYGENKASCSSINVVGISVNIVLEKKEPGVWTNLTTLKYSWIRRQLDNIQLSEDDEEEEEYPSIKREDMPPKGFLSEFLEESDINCQAYPEYYCSDEEKKEEEEEEEYGFEENRLILDHSKTALRDNV